MSKAVALNNKTHRNLRVITRRGEEFGEDVNLVPVVADEIRNLVLEYPVFITKNPNNGQFSLCALLGFEPGENLFLKGNKWNAQYIPMHIRRQPFMIGYKNHEPGSKDDIVVTIDMNSKRVQESEGERLFNDDGSKSPLLETMIDLLSRLMSGTASTETFLKYLVDNDLIETARLRVKFSSKGEVDYGGLYTINEEKLWRLDAKQVTDMHQRGYLQAAYWLCVSTGQVRKLIAMKEGATSDTDVT